MKFVKLEMIKPVTNDKIVSNLIRTALLKWVPPDEHHCNKEYN